MGVIPRILNKWFAERKKFKGMMFQYEKEGNEELKDFYDRRQHVQKILLNSIYGVLGLASFRFYDLDNALAVTASGQDVIKTTAKFINSKYKAAGVPKKSPEWLDNYWELLKSKKTPDVPRPSADDHCVYIDTDSVYFSAVPLAEVSGRDLSNREDMLQFTIDTALTMEKDCNTFYNTVAKLMFNCDKHRLRIKGEAVMETALWIAKKRYAMKKVYDLEAREPVNKEKPSVKGLDVVRSSFPKAFAKVMTEVLMAILKKQSKESLDTMIIDFRKSMKDMDYVQLAKNTSVKELSKWDDPQAPSMNSFISKTPAHVKAALAYNRLVKHFNQQNKFPMIGNGDKIKWVYLKNNPFAIDGLAVKTYDDPPEILEMVEKYMDREKQFEKELENKLADFYTALGWGDLPVIENEVAHSFFDFD